ncbi:hypothetical protein OKW21_002819 [Catalinimonas alkaloidigena]|nr:hypothetical protein [Catalinimonas alkaloidigena]
MSYVLILNKCTKNIYKVKLYIGLVICKKITLVLVICHIFKKNIYLTLRILPSYFSVLYNFIAI